MRDASVGSRRCLEPDMSIEQKPHFWSAVERRNAPIGPSISPITSIESFMQPSQEAFCGALGGTISATGFPNRVTLTGAPVRRTSSNTAKHVALNLEIAISRIFILVPRSKTMVRSKTAKATNESVRPRLRGSHGFFRARRLHLEPGRATSPADNSICSSESRSAAKHRASNGEFDW